jgi:hypothetical protein
MDIHLPLTGELLRAVAPGAPGTSPALPFYIVRSTGKNLRLISVLEPATHDPGIVAIRFSGEAIEVETRAGLHRHTATADGWSIQTATESHRLSGARRKPAPFEPLVRQDRPTVTTGMALQLIEPPVLDGSLDGFESEEPLQLDHEDQYRRSEEPYAGAEEFSASAVVNWDYDALYLAVVVVKSEILARDPATPPLLLDNEPDEIHADGVQVYVKLPGDDQVSGFLIVLSTAKGALITRGVRGTSGSPEMVQGTWTPTDQGYRLTVAINLPGWSEIQREDEIGFDLMVNEMRPDRLRRAGQLVWSGGGGWAWLRGDRQDPARFGKLELR